VTVGSPDPTAKPELTAKFLLQGKIKEKGIIPPEDCIKGALYDEFMTELTRRNINIKEIYTEI